MLVKSSIQIVDVFIFYINGVDSFQETRCIASNNKTHKFRIVAPQLKPREVGIKVEVN